MMDDEKFEKHIFFTNGKYSMVFTEKLCDRETYNNEYFAKYLNKKGFDKQTFYGDYESYSIVGYIDGEIGIDGKKQNCCIMEISDPFYYDFIFCDKKSDLYDILPKYILMQSQRLWFDYPSYFFEEVEGFNKK